MIVVSEDSLTPSGHVKDVQFPTDDIDTELEEALKKQN